MLKQHKLKSLRSTLNSLLKQYGLDVKIKQYEVFNVWQEAVGEHIAKVAIPQKIDRGVLIVKVEKPVWRNELVYMKGEIIEKVNKLLKEEIVKEIIFR